MEDANGGLLGRKLLPCQKPDKWGKLRNNSTAKHLHAGTLASSAVMYSLSQENVADPVMSDEIVHVFGPASLSNLGPGFDTLGMCLEHIGDTVTARKTDASGVTIRFVDNVFGRGITVNPEKNTAGVAAMLVAERLGYRGGIHLEIEKGFKPGSGIGSSAASAVGAAFATNALLAGGLAKDGLIDAVLGGESVASGARHGDNVIPALMGGLVLVSSSDPRRYRKIATPGDLWFIVILPEVRVLTRQARAMRSIRPLRWHS